MARLTILGPVAQVVAMYAALGSHDRARVDEPKSAASAGCGHRTDRRPVTPQQQVVVEPPVATEGLGHGGQHTIAVATTAMC